MSTWDLGTCSLLLPLLQNEAEKKKGQLMAVTWNWSTVGFIFLCVQELETSVPVLYVLTGKMACTTRCPFPLSVDLHPLTSVFAVSLGL